MIVHACEQSMSTHLTTSTRLRSTLLATANVGRRTQQCPGRTLRRNLAVGAVRLDRPSSPTQLAVHTTPSATARGQFATSGPFAVVVARATRAPQ